MIESFLSKCLHPVLEAETQLRRRRVTIGVLVVGAIGFLALLALAISVNWWSWPAVLGWMAILAIVSLIGIIRAGRKPDLRAIARQVEDSHPDLQAALLAAMDQKTEPGQTPSFLQRRLIAEISEHAVKNRWVRKVSAKRLTWSAWGQFASVIGFCLSVWFLLGQVPDPNQAVETEPGIAPALTEEPAQMVLSVTPGDVEIEKGSRLVIEANFSNRAPATAMLVVTNAEGERKIPMKVGLDDSVFSALLPKVILDGSYEVRFENETSDEFSIEVFEFPALVQSDALISPPAYLQQEPEEKIDTQKITVMEGSRVDWSIRVNKPLAAAELFGEDEVSIPLAADSSDPTLLTATHNPVESQKYRLHLVDEDDRGNKRPPWITVNVKRNEPPELKFTFPGRDFEVSPVQEVPIEGEAWDDVQIEKVGFSYQLDEEETEVVLSEEALSGGETHNLTSFIDVEQLGVEPRDLITYYFWAEDLDSEGNLRRTTSDMFFAEVRFFEEIIREGQPPSGQPGQPDGEAGQLLKLQKDVINAAWKLRRYHDLGRPFESYIEDLEVVQESQLVALSKVDQVIAKANDPELKAIYEQARALMQQAADEFLQALNERKGALIEPAHQTARAVFAKLIEARQRESEIAMSKEPSQGTPSEREQRNMNLELKQNELKYEEQSKAMQEQITAEQKEDLAVLNRLKELARRQEAIAKKIKELEEQLQNANEEERNEIERQLKRLQEEQRELLREADDLSERMDSEQNRANMSEQRDQLEEARENIQETAEQLEEGNLADAANSATRAQEELKEMEEEFRERTSRKFSDEMRGLRQKARDLAENQERISESLEEMTEPGDEDALGTEAQLNRSRLAQEISEQVNRLNEVVEEMKTLSEQAEASEPILSDSLYEAVRSTMMNGVEDSLEEARDYTFYNRPNQAIGPQEAASRGIEELKENVEAAAEKILGNEADALRLARSELDRLIEESREESQRLAGTQPGEAGEKANEENPVEGSQPSNGEQASAESPEAGYQQETDTPGEGDSSRGESGKGKGGEQLAENEENQAGGEGENPDGQPGEGKGKMADNGESPGQQDSPGGEKGKAPGKGRTSGEGEESGEGGEESLAQGGQRGDQPGQGSRQSRGEGQDGENPGEQNQASAGSRNGSGGLSLGGDDRGSRLPSSASRTGPLFFNQPTEQRQPGPITGEGYGEFRDRLGNLEEMIPQEDLRNRIARVADDARQMRVEFSRDNLPPEAATIDQKITQPLLELRQRISEEIAKLNRENPIAPIDRDPVPSEFRDLVRRYYEELGSGN